MKIGILLFIIWGLFPHSLFADSLYEVSSTQCRPFLFQNGRWNTAGSYPLNTRFYGMPHPQKADSILFRCGGTFCSYPVSCLNPVESPSPSAVRSPAEVSSESTATQKSISLNFSLSSWQETLQLYDASQTLYPLQSTQLAVSLGLTWQKPFSANWRWSLAVDAIYGQAEAAEQSSQTQVSSILYRAQNVSLFGGQLAPGILWTTPSLASLGLSVPIVYRKGLWPSPGSGYQLTQAIILPGIVVTGELGNSAFRFSTKIGFLGGFSSFYWSLGLGLLL